MSINCKRALFKVSGEALMGNKSFGHDFETLQTIAEDIKEVVNLGVQVCVVVGGGNIYRGIDAAVLGMERAAADYMGMLATVINALALQNTMEKTGIYTRVQSAIPMTTICEPFYQTTSYKTYAKRKGCNFCSRNWKPLFYN